MQQPEYLFTKHADSLQQSQDSSDFRIKKYRYKQESDLYNQNNSNLYKKEENQDEYMNFFFFPCCPCIRK